VADLSHIFERRVDFEPAAELEVLLKDIPAKWVVYLFCDQQDQPVQLLCVKNLRYSLKRRLSGQQQLGPTRRVSYRDLVRRIHWRRVDSAFEADWVYLEAARQLFPQNYQGMVGFRPAWFIHVNPEAIFPRYTKTTDLTGKAGLLIGPVEDKHAAQRLIELAEDCFDLCRYYNILVESPRGKPCAYKEMAKCPAPCDGSISMTQYQEMVARSAQAIVDPPYYVAEQTRRMQEAAAGLAFETANKIKARIDQAQQFGRGPFRHAKPLEDFAFLSLQRGPWKGTAKLFLIVRGTIQHVACLTGEPVQPAELLCDLLRRAKELAERERSAADTQRVALVSNHLFAAKQSHGVLLRLDSIDEKSLAKAFRDLRNQKDPEETDAEGIVKELQAM
jgi:excinuclease UvrABC nuclease subunit